MADPGATCALLIGEGRLADATERALEDAGAAVRRLREPDDREIRAALDATVARVVIASRFDHVSLRIALVVAHIRPDLPSLVTIFDRDVAAHLEQTVANVHVLSMADVVAPAFAGPCLGEGLLSVVRRADGVEGVRALDGEPRRVKAPWSRPGIGRRILGFAHARASPFDSSAQILLGGVTGLAAVFVAETLMTMLAGGLSFVDALYAVANVTVTADPNPAAETAGDWFKLVSTVLMLLSLAFVAVLTAGLVNWLLDPRLTGILGRAVVPRRDHVVVVGLGQVGLRLCGLLRELGVPVVAVEQNAHAKNVPRAKDRGLPVVIGSGSSQRLLRRLSIRHARALAAVTSDEIENLAIAVAAQDVQNDLNLTFRAGDGDLTSETRSLFRVGVVRDVYAIAGAALAAVALGHPARHAFQHDGRVYLVDDSGDIDPFGAAGGAEQVPAHDRGRRIELLYFEGCPGHAELLPRVHALAAGRAEVELHAVESLEEAERVGFLGSPTLRVDGEDVEPSAAGRTDYGMKCRLYRTDEGQLRSPPDEWIRRALDGG